MHETTTAELQGEIALQVRIALLEKTAADHEGRLQSLERWRLAMLTFAATAACSSTATLALFLLNHSKL